MNNILEKFKRIPKGVKICEVLYIAVIALYGYMLSGGGLFTSYYSFMAVIVTAAVSVLYLIFFKKSYIAASANAAIALIIFFHFMSVA